MHKKESGRTRQPTLVEPRNISCPVRTTGVSVSLTPLAGPVVATFTAGQIINIEVTISTYHDGYYEFRLCVPKGVNDQPPTTNQGMLDCLMDPATPILKRVNPLPAGSRSTYKMFTPPVWTAEQLAIRWRQTPQVSFPLWRR